MKSAVYNLQGAAVSEIDLPDAVFSRKWSADLVHQAMVAQAANARSPWAHAKGRGEVSGGGRKPWKQKHTGRARHGSIRSPIWKGGGVSHGPVKERTYEQKLNKKMLRAALAMVLSRRLHEGELKIVDALPQAQKTKELMKQLAGVAPRQNALLIPAAENKMIYRASRNVPSMKSVAPNSLNVADLLRYKHIVMDQNAVGVIAKTYGRNK